MRVCMCEPMPRKAGMSKSLKKLAGSMAEKAQSYIQKILCNNWLYRTTNASKANRANQQENQLVKGKTSRKQQQESFGNKSERGEMLWSFCGFLESVFLALGHDFSAMAFLYLLYAVRVVQSCQLVSLAPPRDWVFSFDVNVQRSFFQQSCQSRNAFACSNGVLVILVCSSTFTFFASGFVF